MSDMMERDRFRLEEIVATHPIGADIFVPFAILRLGEEPRDTEASLMMEIPADDPGFTGQGNVAPSALALGPFQDNGGPTSTLLPGPASVAVDQVAGVSCGGNFATDQRGIARPQGALCDIGAVEVEQP